MIEVRSALSAEAAIGAYGALELLVGAVAMTGPSPKRPHGGPQARRSPGLRLFIPQTPSSVCAGVRGCPATGAWPGRTRAPGRAQSLPGTHQRPSGRAAGARPPQARPGLPEGRSEARDILLAAPDQLLD